MPTTKMTMPAKTVTAGQKSSIFQRITGRKAPNVKRIPSHERRAAMDSAMLEAAIQRASRLHLPERDSGGTHPSRQSHLSGPVEVAANMSTTDGAARAKAVSSCGGCRVPGLAAHPICIVRQSRNSVEGTGV